MEEFKRLFFALEIAAPWPKKLPEGRLIDEPLRHLTLAFLGKADFQKIRDLLSQMPLPSFKVGFAGAFDECLFLPKRHPRVVAWHVDWLDDPTALIDYAQKLSAWLKEHELLHDDRSDLLPHVTLCRGPFVPQFWKEAFIPLPLMTLGIHLYESLPHSKYQSCWHTSLKPPFDEIEHTADIAFHIHGETLSQIYHHAQIALAFKFPALLPYLQRGDHDQPLARISHALSRKVAAPSTDLGSQIGEAVSHKHCPRLSESQDQSTERQLSAREREKCGLEEIIMKLNESIAHADGDIGCPFKAVSFHGELQKNPDQTFVWEMIVDV